MVIGITITNTLRNHLTKLTTVYESMMDKEPINLPINPYELEDHYPTVVLDKEEDEFDEKQVAYTQSDDYLGEFTEDEKEFNVYQLLYVDGSFEIFGACDEVFPGVIKKVSDVAAATPHKIIMVNLESPRSKLATMYFLSKTNFDMREIYFPENRDELWEKFDIMITDDPKILGSKPEGKKTVKVCNIFNNNVDSDYAVPNIKVLLNDFDNAINKFLAGETWEPIVEDNLPKIDQSLIAEQ